MKKLEMDLLTNIHTQVMVESDFKCNAPHYFTVEEVEEPNEILAEIQFQEGPKECGINGVANEDLINIVICRLEHYQQSESRCRENALAITALEESLLWLRKRTMARENQAGER